MKYVIIMIPPAIKDVMLKELHDNGITRVIMSETLAAGANTTHTEVVRGRAYDVGEARRLKFEMAVNDDFVEKVLEVAGKVAAQDKLGGGKAFVLPLDDAIRLGTGERGSKAIN